jgi:hypothetical protein
MTFLTTQYIIITLLIITIFTAAIYYNIVITEPFTETSEKTEIANKIYKFIRPDTKYSEFLDFLKKINNKSYNIIKQETFYEMKTLYKMNNLKVSDIVNYLNDI